VTPDQELQYLIRTQNREPRCGQYPYDEWGPNQSPTPWCTGDQDIEQVRKYLDRLPPDDRQCAEMLLEGCTFRQIAAKLGMTNPSAQQLFKRCCERLRYWVEADRLRPDQGEFEAAVRQYCSGPESVIEYALTPSFIEVQRRTGVPNATIRRRVMIAVERLPAPHGQWLAFQLAHGSASWRGQSGRRGNNAEQQLARLAQEGRTVPEIVEITGYRESYVVSVLGELANNSSDHLRGRGIR